MIDRGFQALSNSEVTPAIRRKGDCFALWFVTNGDPVSRLPENLSQGSVFPFPVPEESLDLSVCGVGAQQDHAAVR